MLFRSETTFETWVKVAKIAFEEASDKITVPGAKDLLMLARWGDLDTSLPEEEKTKYPRALHFVSSSPPQLRNVLEEKLIMDGVDWSSDTFKNQAYNIRKGRFDLLKHQVVYKTAAILKLIGSQAENTSFILLGDNAESDAYIYTGIKLLVERKLEPKTFEKYLEISGVEKEVAELLWAEIPYIPKSKIAMIFIRNIPEYENHALPPLTKPVILFETFLDVGLHMYLQDLLAIENVSYLIRKFHNHYSLSLHELGSKLKKCINSKITEHKKNELENLFSRLFSDEDLDLNVKEKYEIPNLEEWDSITASDILNQADAWIKALNKSKKKES